MTRAYDKRITAARPDLAASHLRDWVKADRYADGEPRKIIVPRTPIKASPEHMAPYTSELLFGEGFTIYEIKNGWAWGQAELDGYVGYVPEASLGHADAPSHSVVALSSHVYPEPDLKLPPLMQLYLGSQVTVTDRAAEKGFLPITAGWVYAAHLRPINAHASDFVSEAERFLHTPYLWGGRSPVGIDCSGLVQVSLAATGVMMPRDSDQQLRAMEKSVDPKTSRQRGDIVFFPGHVGIMLDETRLLHANATHMAVTINPLNEVTNIVARTTSGPPVSGIRRI